WTQVDYYQMLNLTAWGRKKHERQEQEAFKQADLATIVSPHWKQDLEAIGAKNVRVLYWGYDPEDFAGLERYPHEKFTLTHLGIMGYDRNPEILFEAIRQLKAEEPGFAEDFELRLYGQVDHRVRASIEAHDLLEQTNFAGTVDRAEALQEMKNSHVLLLLLNQQENALGRVPGKLFEYLAVHRPIVNFGPVESDVAAMIEETESGATFPYDLDPALVARKIKEHYAVYKGRRRAGETNARIEQYSHPQLVLKLSTFLDEIAA
ncbi:MAG: glycosyltransferase, partial [Lewinella sp.]